MRHLSKRQEQFRTYPLKISVLFLIIYPEVIIMKCLSCGATLRQNDRFCPYCGTEAAMPAPKAETPVIHVHLEQPAVQARTERVYIERTVQPRKSELSRLVMLLLFLFLGALGVHRFYQGRFGMGVLYLLTGGLCGVGLIVDFFIILVGNPKDKYGLPICWN